MIIIITMAGLGKRFRDAGYDCPKYMIETKGKSLFEWALDSLNDYNAHTSKYVFVVRREDDAEGFIRDKCESYDIKNIEVIELDRETDGQATSCLLALDNCDENESMMVYNIDTYIERDELKYQDIQGDGYIPCFHSEGDHWSFARTDDNGKVVEVREKDRISDNCTLGAYYFSSVSLYRNLYDEYYASDINLEKGEKYIAPLYNHMIRKGLDVRISIVDFAKVHVLGTPEELKAFEE